MTLSPRLILPAVALLLLDCVSPRKVPIAGDDASAESDAVTPVGVGGSGGAGADASALDGARENRDAPADSPLGAADGAPACTFKGSTCVGDTLQSCGADGGTQTLACPFGCNAVTN